MKRLLKHPRKIVATVVGVIVYLVLASQGVPPPAASAIGAQVGHAAGEVAQEVADQTEAQ